MSRWSGKIAAGLVSVMMTVYAMCSVNGRYSCFFTPHGKALDGTVDNSY